MALTTSRYKKTWLNAKVSLLFYVVTLLLSFFARKIFLEYLGDSFVGLTGTLLNILGYLNLAEMGIGAAVAFNLYKPIHGKERETITKIVSLFGYYYNRIGWLVLGLGVLIGAFIPLIFHDSGFSLAVIYFAFFSFLVSSLLGYFFNYRHILLVSDQKNYVVTTCYQSSVIIKTILQIIVVYKTRNYYLWIALELLFGIIFTIVLNRCIDSKYPWLHASIALGKEERANFPHILKTTGQVFIHKLKDFLLTQSDQLFVFIFLSLKQVAYYGNYVLIISRLTTLMATTLDNVTASIGNLIAEGNRQRIIHIFWELMAFRYFLAGFVCFCLYLLITPFISLWVGPEYILGDTILYLFIVNLFIMISRGTVDNFNTAYGHYKDTWSAWVEVIINMAVTIVGGYFWGISGILLGKTVSMIPIVIFWKPFYLFSSGFGASYGNYWKHTVIYYLVLAIASVIGFFAMRCIPVNAAQSFGWWIVYALCCCLVFGVIYGCGIVFLCPGGKHLANRILKKELL